MVLLKELVEEAKLKNRKKKIEPTIKGKKGEKRKRNHYKKYKTKTGFYNLYIIKCEKCSQGFFWQYKFEEINISRVDFFELKRIHEIGVILYCFKVLNFIEKCLKLCYNKVNII